MTTAGIVVAAGSGSRFGGEKQHQEINGRPLWTLARDVLLASGLEDVIIVGPVPGGVEGGLRRRDSVSRGLAALTDSVTHVMVHDAARPLATPALVGRVLERLRRDDADAVIPAVAVRDTIKEVSNSTVLRTIDRSPLVAVQTPQGFIAESLRRAHAHSDDDASDDAALVELWGGTVVAVEGEPTNLKITYPSDLAVARALTEGEVVVGTGYDAHRFGDEPPLRLAGVIVDSTRGIVATSDGDVVAHAVADAVLGAAGLGDLGEHFPSSDPRWQGADSMSLLREVIVMSRLRLRHLDLTVVAEEVRVAPHRDSVRAALAGVFDVEVEAISVKATTTDGLGGIGADEGMAAAAVVTMVRT